MQSRSFRASARREDRRRALGDDVLRSPDRGGGVHREDLADDEPVAEHADDRGQVLLDGRTDPGCVRAVAAPGAALERTRGTRSPTRAGWWWTHGLPPVGVAGPGITLIAPMPAAAWSGRRASDRRGRTALTSDPSAAGARWRRSPPSTWGRLAGHRRCPNAAGVISQGLQLVEEVVVAGVHEEGSLEFRPGGLRDDQPGDQDGLNCVDRVRRHLGVAVGTAAGRRWAGTLRHWPLHERRARRARCLRRREEAVTKRRPARRRQPGARSGGGEMVTASGSMSEDDDGGGALAGGKGAAGMPARSAAVGGARRDAGHARRLARHRRGVMIRVLIVKD